ncbi:hypothetical protein [Streptomyces sioyaensis]
MAVGWRSGPDAGGEVVVDIDGGPGAQLRFPHVDGMWPTCFATNTTG